MRHFEETRIIPCKAEHFYAIVLDIDRYADFLPWVTRSEVLQRDETMLTAELVASLAGKEYRFQTADRFIAPQHIDIHLLQGPFHSLESSWSFEDIGSHSCRVHFSIAFAFNSKMLDVLAGPVFSTACRSMVKAFEQRVQRVYGAQTC